MVNVVVFAPTFMGYDKQIRNKLVELGNRAYLFDQRSVRSGFGKAVSKKAPKFLSLHNKIYYKRLLNSIDFYPDIVLVIQGDMFEHSSMEIIHKKWPKAKTVLYLWDNLENLHGVRHKLTWFDKVFSFDPTDARKFDGIRFRPLFFTDDFGTGASTQRNNYDLSSIGTIHSDRYSVIRKITKIAKSRKLKVYQFNYLPARWLFTLYKLFKKGFEGAKPGEFSFEKMPLGEISKIQKSSKVILDINHPKQRGLTIRTIEIMALGKKMITTNSDIVNYDFFNPQNVFVMSRNNVELPPQEFFDSAPVAIPEKIREGYSIEHWVREVLGI